MKVGDFAELRRQFSAEDLREYAAVSGHSVTGDCLPEPLIGALFSRLLGVRLPGTGTCYLKQDTHFHHTARVDDHLVARVEITRLRPEKQLVDLATTCTGPDGRLIISGRALVMLPDATRWQAHGG